MAALVRAGWTYYSDEFAFIGHDGLVAPYARPLGLRGPRGHTRRVSVASLGGVAAVAPAPVALVLSTRYEAQYTIKPNINDDETCQFWTDYKEEWQRTVEDFEKAKDFAEPLLSYYNTKRTRPLEAGDSSDEDAAIANVGTHEFNDEALKELGVVSKKLMLRCIK